MRRRLLIFAACLSACAAPAAPSPPPATVPIAPPAPAARVDRIDPTRGPHGEKAEIAGQRVKITLASGATELIEPAELHAPPGDPTFRGIAPTAVIFLPDGTLMIGASDGTINLVDGSRHRRASIGLRGGICGLTPAGEGLVAATTELGVMALVTREGELRWERQITSEPLGAPVFAPGRAILAASVRAVFAVAPTGEFLFSHASSQLSSERVTPRPNNDYWGYRRPTQVPHGHPPSLSIDRDTVSAGEGLSFRLDDPHPEAPSLAPVFSTSFHRVLEGTVTSLIAGGPGEVWALVRKPTPMPVAEPLLPPFVNPFDAGLEYLTERYELVHVEGSRVTRFEVPHQGARKEIFLKGTKRKEAGPFWIDGLVPGPGDRPWILARRISIEASPGGSDGEAGPQYGAGQALELQGTAVRERDAADDLQKAFFEHIVYEPIAAARGLLCFGSKSPICAELGEGNPRLLPSPGRVIAVTRVGRTEWLLTHDGKLHRRDGSQYAPIAAPDTGTLFAVAGARETDVWGEVGEAFHVVRFDGKQWARVPLPAEVPSGFVARAADDVWTGNGRAHWDGQRWSRVFGAVPANAVIAASKDEVWLGGDGLWRGTAPGPVPARVPAAREETTLAAATPLVLGPPANGYVIAPARLAELTSARSVSTSPDETVWMQTWNRLVEVVDDKATRLREVRRHELGRWAQPEGKGRGYLLDHGYLRRLEKPAAEDVQLDRHDAVALHSNGHGTTWLVGTPAPPSYAEPNPYELSPHALVIADTGAPRPVLGLPSAAYCDVAVAEDGGAWLAGGLSPGPSGEGILFHARGRSGADAAARFRAPATLFAVTAIGTDEAWAVGAAGAILHVRGADVTRLTLPSGAWLRAVFAAAPDDVWIGGDAGTLIHYDGKSFQPVTHPLGPDAAMTGIAAARGVVWVVGPSGILRIRKSGSP